MWARRSRIWTKSHITPHKRAQAVAGVSAPVGFADPNEVTQRHLALTDRSGEVCMYLLDGWINVHTAPAPQSAFSVPLSPSFSPTTPTQTHSYASPGSVATHAGLSCNGGRCPLPRPSRGMSPRSHSSGARRQQWRLRRAMVWWAPSAAVAAASAAVPRCAGGSRGRGTPVWGKGKEECRRRRPRRSRMDGRTCVARQRRRLGSMPRVCLSAYVLLCCMCRSVWAPSVRSFTPTCTSPPSIDDVHRQNSLGGDVGNREGPGVCLPCGRRG